MQERVKRYIKWNNALIQHFFKNAEQEEVFLYINEGILDQIGQANELGDCADFIDTVSIKVNERLDFYHEIRRALRVYNNMTPEENRRIANEGRSLFTFGVLLSEQWAGNRVLFFNIIILAIYVVSQAQDKNENALGKRLSKYLTDNLDDNGNRDSLEDLFTKLHQTYPAFKNLKLSNQRYVGLLKYQLVLSHSQIDSLEENLYKNGFSYSDETSSYEEFVYRIHDYVPDDIKRLLDNSISSRPHRKRLEDIFINFDPEEYEAAHPDNIQRRIVGSFVHALYFGGDDNGKIVLLTDIKDYVNRGNIKIIEEDFDSLAGYNPHHVLINERDQVSLAEDYRINDNDYLIRTIDNDGIIFFKKVNDEYFIETHQLTEDDTYIAVQGNNRRWNTFRKNEKERNARIICIIGSFPEIFGDGWTIYESENGFTSQFYKDSIQINNRNVNLNSNRIIMKSGIKPKNKINVYLANALPYFDFPIQIDEACLEVNINLDGHLLDPNQDYQLLYDHENRLIIDLTGNVDVRYPSSEIDISVEYHSDLFNDVICSSFSICRQEINYDVDQLYKYDRWGQFLETAEEGEHYLRGNTIHGVQQANLTGTTLDVNAAPLNSLDNRTFYFINLLSAICFMNNNQPQTIDKLKKCIRYSSTRNHIDYMQDESFVSRLRDTLINCGYITPCYEGNRTRYQALPPTFVKRPAGLDNTSRFILTGCYTQKFISDLFDYCRRNGVQLETREVSANPLVPPTILIGRDFNLDGFQTETRNLFEKTTSDFALELLQFIPKISEYQNTLTLENGIFNTPLQTCNGMNIFPRVRKNLATGYQMRKWIEQKEDEFYNSSVSDFKWMDLYCRYRRNRPFVITNGTNEICLPRGVQIPFLLERSLCLMNAGAPRTEKAFISDNTLTDEPLFSYINVYHISAANNRLGEILNVLTNNSNIENNTLVSRRASGYLQFDMELWTRKPQKLEDRNQHENGGNKRNNWKYWVALKLGQEYLAFANKEKAFINIDSNYFCTVGTPNAILTTLLKHAAKNLTWNQMGIEITQEIINDPDFNEYTIEKLTIK